jgi:uncharacterized protein YndB with AHSA1/START domain
MLILERMQMKDDNLTITYIVEQSPQRVFEAIANVRGWWSEDIEGDTNTLGALFYYHFKDVHRGTFKITEFEPGKKIVWRVLQNYLNFVKDPTEWTGTDIVFEIAEKKDGKTEFRFTHIGLKPSEECYVVCHDAWGFYIKKSLHDFITKGVGEPNRKDVLSNNNPIQK